MGHGHHQVFFHHPETKKPGGIGTATALSSAFSTMCGSQKAEFLASLSVAMASGPTATAPLGVVRRKVPGTLASVKAPGKIHIKNVKTYPPVMTNIAIENCPFIVDLLLHNGDFP